MRGRPNACNLQSLIQELLIEAELLHNQILYLVIFAQKKQGSIKARYCAPKWLLGATIPPAPGKYI